MKNTFLLPFATLLFLFACQKEPVDYQEAAHDPEFMHASVKKLTDVIVYDIFSPPVASRIYAYPSIAAYEVLINEYPEYQSLAGQLKGLPPTPKPEADQEYCYPLASLQAYITEGKKLIFSEEKIDTYAQQLYDKFKAMGVPKDVMDRSIAYGDQVAKHIGDWADQDNYHQSRTFPKFTINDDTYRWQPTPPDYMDAIEPHWNKIRTFVLDSAHQFIPEPPTPFDMEENSTFYKEVMEVYETGEKLTEEQGKYSPILGL